MKLYHKIFAVVFILALFAFSVCNIAFNTEGLKKEIEALTVPETLKEVQAYTAEVDATLTGNLLFGHAWNEMYAEIYNIIGKNEENSFKYVRDKDGMLHSGNFWNTLPENAKEYAMRILRLKEHAEENGAKVVVFLYPCLYNEAWSDGYYGMPYTDYNYLIEDLAAYFRYYGIDCINYQDIFIEENRTAEEIFYKTDHHWRVEAAFDAFCMLTKKLNDVYGENLDLYYTEKDNYTFDTYENFYIGSQGRDTGVEYVGADDFIYIIPKFDTSYRYEFARASNGEYEASEGNIQDTLLNMSYIYQEDYYDREMYSSYLGGVRYHDKITNLANEEGLNVLFLRDSYASPLATFFSAYCNNMELYWTINTEAEVMEKAVESGDFDYVFVGLYVDNYASGLEFYMEEEKGTEEAADE